MPVQPPRLAGLMGDDETEDVAEIFGGEADPLSWRFESSSPNSRRYDHGVETPIYWNLGA